MDREPAPGPTGLASPGDAAALGSLAHAIGIQKPAKATDQDMQLGANLDDGDDTDLLAAAGIGDLQTSGPGADEGDVSLPDASVTVAVTDRRPTAEMPSGTGTMLLDNSLDCTQIQLLQEGPGPLIPQT